MKLGKSPAQVGLTKDQLNEIMLALQKQAELAWRKSHTGNPVTLWYDGRFEGLSFAANILIQYAINDTLTAR